MTDISTVSITDIPLLLDMYKHLSEVWHEEDERSEIIYALECPYKFVYILRINNQPVGTAAIFLEPKISKAGRCCAHLEDVVVYPEHHGKGYGKELVDFCVRQSRLFNCYKIILSCSDHNIPFYEKCGFEKYENCMKKSLI